MFQYRGSEAEILEGLTATVQATDPDIITGYNIDNFDLLVWQTERACFSVGVVGKVLRICLVGGVLPGWKPNSSGIERAGSQTPEQSCLEPLGRVQMDAWWQARQALRPRRETLSFVASPSLPRRRGQAQDGRGRIEHGPRVEPTADEVMAYCVRVLNCPSIFSGPFKPCDGKEAVAAVAKVPFETAANGSTSQLIDSLVIRLADVQHVAVPLTGSAEAKEGQITAATCTMWKQGSILGLPCWISRACTPPS